MQSKGKLTVVVLLGGLAVALSTTSQSDAQDMGRVKREIRQELERLGVTSGFSYDASGSNPVGTVEWWAGDEGAIPSGWLACDGQAVSRTTYATLYNQIGTTYGAGDGSTTYNLPDLRGRSPLGTNNANLANGASGSFSTRNPGATGGEETHTLTTSEMPSHNHPVSKGGDSTQLQAEHSGSLASSDSTRLALSTGGTLPGNNLIDAQSVGGGSAHNVMSPFQVLTPIIRYE